METVVQCILKRGLSTSRIFRDSEVLTVSSEMTVGWAFFFFMHPLVVHHTLHPNIMKPFYLLIPSNAALKSFTLPDYTHRLLRTIPWWQRIALASSVRTIDGVIFTKSSRFIQQWKSHPTITWLGYIDHPSFLGHTPKESTPNLHSFLAHKPKI